MAIHTPTKGMSKAEFDSEGRRLDGEFQSFILDRLRLKKLWKKKQFKTLQDGTIEVTKPEYTTVVARTYKYESDRTIRPITSVLADNEDLERQPSDFAPIIDHYATRYERGLDLITGKPLEGEARKEWESLQKSAKDRPEFKPVVRQEERQSNHAETENGKILKDVFAYINKLSPEGIRKYQQMVKDAIVD